LVTAADRDAAARAAAVTLDDDVPGVVESPEEPVIDLTQEEDPGGIIASALGGDDQEPVVNEPMLIPAGGEDQPMQADEPVGGDDQEPVVNEPVKIFDNLVDLTQDDDPGGVIAGVVNEPASMDPTNPEQPHNILWQQPSVPASVPANQKAKKKRYKICIHEIFCAGSFLPMALQVLVTEFVGYSALFLRTIEGKPTCPPIPQTRSI
jgi:hypothetical protein